MTATQRRLGLSASKGRQIPLKEIDDRDVLASIEFILYELRRVKTQRGISRQINPASVEIEKTSSMVYKSLADASFMLDGLRGRPVRSDDVYLNALYVLDEIALIAERLNVAVNIEPTTPVDGAAKPTDIAIQLMRARHNLVNLQRELQMNWSDVPKTTVVRVTPSENCDALNILLAEMTRIKLHLGINVPLDARAEPPTGKESNDVLALVVLLGENLETLAAAVTG